MITWQFPIIHFSRLTKLWFSGDYNVNRNNLSLPWRAISSIGFKFPLNQQIFWFPDKCVVCYQQHNIVCCVITPFKIWIINTTTTTTTPMQINKPSQTCEVNRSQNNNSLRLYKTRILSKSWLIHLITWYGQNKTSCIQNHLSGWKDNWYCCALL